MEKSEKVDGGMVATLVMLAFFICLLIFFLVMRYYRELTNKWRYWDDPEHDPWRADQGKVFPSYPKADWEPLLNDTALEKMSHGTCGRKSRVVSRATSRVGSRAASRAVSRASSRATSRMGSRSGSIVGIPNEGCFRNMSGLPRDPDQFEFDFPPAFADFLSKGLEEKLDSSEQALEDEDSPSRPCIPEECYVPQELSKLVFASEGKRVYRKTPVGFRSGSHERRINEEISKEKETTEKSNKTKGILKVKNETKALSKFPTKSCEEEVSLKNNLKRTSPRGAEEDLSPTPKAKVQIKKSSKKNNRTSINTSTGIKPEEETLSPVLRKEETTSTTSSAPNTSESLPPPKKTYKKIKKTKEPMKNKTSVSETASIVTTTSSLKEETSSPTISTTCSSHPSATQNSTPSSSSPPIPPKKKSYKKLKKQPTTVTMENGTDTPASPQAASSDVTVDIPA